MNVFKSLTDWQNARHAYNNTVFLVQAFYTSDPLGPERHTILRELIEVERFRIGRDVNLQRIPERTLLIKADFAKAAPDHPNRFGHREKLDAERSGMIRVLASHPHTLKGAARAVVLDRMVTASLESIARVAFIPRSWGRWVDGAESRREILVQKALAFQPQ